MIDFSDSFLSVETGKDSDGVASTATIDFDGSRGQLLEAAGTLTLGVGGFFYVTGSLAITKSSETLRLSDESSVDVDLLTIGGTGINAFAGVLYDTPQAAGLLLTNTEFAVAMGTDKQNTARKWTTLQASVGSVAVVGVTGLTIEATDLSVIINRSDAVDELVVDYKSEPLTVRTSSTESLTIDLDGDLGPLLKASGTLTVNVSDFFTVSGSFAVEKLRETVTLSDKTTVDSDLLTLGGTNISALPETMAPQPMKMLWAYIWMMPNLVS